MVLVEEGDCFLAAEEMDNFLFVFVRGEEGQENPFGWGSREIGKREFCWAGS